MLQFLCLPASDAVPNERASLWSVEALIREGLGPALYYRLQELGWEYPLTEPERQALSQAFRHNAARNLVLETELRQVIQAFNARGITVMLLKGAISFFAPLYPCPAIRVMGDLDLLVLSQHMETAVHCLLALGFQPQRDGKYSWHLEQTFLRDGIYLDLHQGLIRVAPFTNPAAFWHRARAITCQEGLLYVPCDEDQFYHRFLHDTLHDHALLWLPLRHAYEAAWLLRRLQAMSAERLDELARRANRDGLGLLLGAYLAQVTRLFYRFQTISPLLDQLLQRGTRELEALPPHSRWPAWLRFALTRATLMRLRREAQGGYGKTFWQVMVRESLLEEPPEVVPPRLLPRLLHCCRLLILQGMVGWLRLLWKIGTGRLQR